MKRKLIRLVAKFAITTGLLLAVYRHVSRQELSLDITEIPLWPVLAFFVLLLFNTLLSVHKWKLLLAADREDIPASRLFTSYMIGTFFNLFLPSSIGGDVYRIASIGRRGRMMKSAASVVADRTSGFLALSVISLVFSIAGYSQFGHHVFVLVPLVLLVGIAGFILAAFHAGTSRAVLNATGVSRFPRVMAVANTLLESFLTYRRNPGLLVRIMGISFLFQFTIVVCIFLLSRAIHLTIPFTHFCIFVPIITVMEAIPISIYGVGLRDAGYVFFFTQVGLANAESHALAMAVLYIVLTAIYASWGGILFALRPHASGTETAPASSAAAPTPVAPARPITVAIMLRHIGDPGGITVYTDNIIRHILALDTVNRYILLLPDPAFRGRYGTQPNLREIVIESSNAMLDRIVWDQHEILKALSGIPVDVIYNPKLSVPMRASSRTVFTMHGLEQFASRRHFLWFDRFYFSMATRFYCSKADAILVMTRTGKRDLQKHLRVPPGKIRVIPESYNESCRRIINPAALAAVRDRLHLPDRFILFLGGITPLKNIPTLLRAYRILKDKGLPHTLVLSGFKRWKFTTDLDLIQSLGLRDDVRETGFVEDADIPALYTLADAFVLPSYYEGFGIPILEAQACGCPVVTSDRGAMPEVAGEGGSLTFNPDVPAELAESLERVLTQDRLRTTLIASGLENVRQYSWRATALNTIRVFEDLANADGPVT